MKFEILSRRAAAELGRTRYYTGRPCKWGHDAQRFVSTGVCVACNAARSKMFSRAVAQGSRTFSYTLHPDDFDAARAFCQALDLQRGRVPYVMEPTPKGAEPLALPEDIARHRATLLAEYGPKETPAPYLPKP